MSSFAQAKLQAKMRSILAIIALVTVIGFSMAACSDDDDSDGNGNENGSGATHTFTSISAFKTWLDAQVYNTAATAYKVKVKLNVSDLGGDSSNNGSAGNALKSNNGKYVSLDLSDSTFPSIGENTFNGCTSLTNVTIGNKVTSIGKGAFQGCTSLTCVTIPFVGATLNGTSDSHFGYIFGDSSYQSQNIPTSLKTVIIMGGNRIPEAAFYKCSNITNVTIPNSITNIGEQAFENCTSFTSVTIPDSVTSIGGGAFRNCTSLTNVTIGNKVTSIGKGAFQSCTSLIGITIPNKVTSIGEQAFYNCTSFTSVTISDSVTSIGTRAFSSCTRLTNVTIGNKVTSIEIGAFSSCTSLPSITIPNSITSIGGGAFTGCTSLTSVTFATGSNISNSNFGSYASPEGSSGSGGNTLKTAYNAASPKAGTYIREANGDTWTKTSN